MIGLDTNVLLRAFVNDDPAQSAAARRLLGDTRPDVARFVCLMVLVEFAWSLRRTFGYSRRSVLNAVQQIIEASDTVTENRKLVIACLSSASADKVDLADLLIGSGNVAAGCSHTVTFDKEAALRVPGMELLA